MADEVIRIKYVVDGKEIEATVENVEELKKQLGATGKTVDNTGKSVSKLAGTFDRLKSAASNIPVIGGHLSGVIGQIETATGSIGRLSAATKGFGLAFKLALGPIGIAIGVVVAALGGMLTWFKRTGDGGDKLALIMATIKGSIEGLLKPIQNFGEFVYKYFVGSVDEAAMAWDQFSGSVKNFGANMKDAIASQREATIALDDYETMLAQTKPRLAELERAAIGAYEVLNDPDATAIERLNAIGKATDALAEKEKIIKELGQLQQLEFTKRVKDRIDLVDLENQVKNGFITEEQRRRKIDSVLKGEEQDEFYQLQANLIDAETQRIAQSKRLMSQRKTIMIQLAKDEAEQMAKAAAEAAQREALKNTVEIPFTLKLDARDGIFGPETKAYLANIDKEIRDLLPKDLGQSLADNISPWSIKDLKFLYDNYKNTLGDQAGEVLELIREKQAERDEIIFASVDAAQRVSDSLFQITNDRISAEIAALEQKQLVEVGLAGDNQAAIQRINEQYDAKLRELRTKQVRNQKAQGLFDAIINTATAVTKALATGGPVLAAIVGAAGAAQVAAISAQPIPRFKKGTLRVGGTGNDDTVPALLTPGEAVIPVDRNRDYAPVMKAIYNREIPAAVLNAYVKGGARERVVREREVIRDRVNIQIDERGYTTHTIKQANKVTRQLKRMSLNG